MLLPGLGLLPATGAHADPRPSLMPDALGRLLSASTTRYAARLKAEGASRIATLRWLHALATRASDAELMLQLESGFSGAAGGGAGLAAQPPPPSLPVWVESGDGEGAAEETASSAAALPLYVSPPVPAPRTVRNRDVVVTSLTHVPGHRVVRCMGCVNISLVREATAVKRGLSAFLQTVIAEATAVLRGHALALGGNAVLAFHLVPRETDGQSSRSQAYHLVSVSGDVAFITRE